MFNFTFQFNSLDNLVAEKDPNFNIMVISNAYWPFKKTKIYIIDEANFEEDPLSSTYTNIAHMNPHTQKAIEQRKKNIKEFLLRIKNKQEIFKKAYSQIKTSRTLDFFSNVGFVDLDLSFENGTFVFRVTPLSALIIQLFDEEILSMTLGENNSPKKLENQDYSIFTVEFIMEIFAATEAEVRKRINFWVSKGVLRDYSLDPNNYAESSFYVPNDVLPGSFFSANENDGIIFEDEIFNFEFVSLNENKLNLENAVTTILKNSGPKNFEQLLKKLVVSLQVNISEIMLKEILGKLTLDQKIFKEGELFNILVTSN